MSDGVELGGVEAEEIAFRDLAGADQVGEDDRQDRVPVIEVAVDPAAALAEPAFQVPQVRGFRDPRGMLLRFPEDGIEFAAERQVEGPPGDGLLRRGPLPLAHRGCHRVVCAGHAPVLPGPHFSSRPAVSEGPAKNYAGKYPPAEPGALWCEPLKAALRGR